VRSVIKSKAAPDTAFDLARPSQKAENARKPIRVAQYVHEIAHSPFEKSLQVTHKSFFINDLSGVVLMVRKLQFLL
jgi:hypothetical protein